MEGNAIKRIGNIYPAICEFENLYEAYLEARKNKRYKREVLAFSAQLAENLIAIQRELVDRTYKIGKYKQFIVTEPKKRLIMALQFRDRVVQWAIYRQLNPLFDRQFIDDSYACRADKGTHSAVDRLQYWLRKLDRTDKRWYCLKMDISKYFYRVDHKALSRILERKIKDKALLNLLYGIINSDNCAFGLPLDANISDNTDAIRLTDCGMPIGNLTSQMFANLYLNELDHFVKEQLRAHYYIRYMDDMLILSDDKAELHAIKDKIAAFLDTELHLLLNNKTSIFPVCLGVEFVGFRVWATHRKLRKQSAQKLKRGLRNLARIYASGKKTFDEIEPNIMSYFGTMKHFNSYHLRQKISEVFVLQRRGNGTPNATGKEV
jgi:retron-type reverse transcriptase